ncbi:outer membrane beta-barrel protein, partial [bacterium AH-315-K03]|nr:outer membrane beta-barrel protein [bacterium AH-315-K03]
GGYSFEADEPFIEFSTQSAGILAGYKPYKFLGLEVRAGAGLGSNKDEINIEDEVIDISVDFNHYISLYARGELSFKYAKLYALVGYSEAQFTVDVDEYDLSITGSKNGVSYGVGIGLINSDRVSFNLEYLNIIDTDTYSVSGANLSIQFLF